MIYFVKRLIKSTVNTAIPVRVTAVERNAEGNGAGYLTAIPIVTATSAKGEMIPSVVIPKLPYFRYQHGTAAFICDPKVGDIGLAVFAQSDCSNVRGESQEKPPASFRKFDMSDGFYIGGFWGKTPTTFIKIEDSGSIDIKAPESLNIESPEVTIDCDNLTVTAKTKISLTAPEIELNGAIFGGGSEHANAEFSGDVTADGVSLVNHVHTGVQSGSETSGKPQK
jgi:hypothetical protein